jgi:hypothetical protein
MNYRKISQAIGRQHRENMLRTLLGRIESAKAKGDQALVEQLEKERQSLGL